MCLRQPSKSKPYQAQVRHSGKTVHVGLFATAEEAALLYASRGHQKGGRRRVGLQQLRGSEWQQQGLQLQSGLRRSIERTDGNI